MGDGDYKKPDGSGIKKMRRKPYEAELRRL